MIPFVESTGSGPQVARMLVEDCAATVKLVGACEGTGISEMCLLIIEIQQCELFTQR